ncbi:MAG TPA: 30S ribosomal protein S4 [Victivallales bacterium]|nr:30S ribosomal protein S4 [Victivallales bacterium]
MSRYTGPSCKLCRREETKLFLKGERCFKAKCAIERERPIPGAKKQRRRTKLSDYGEQLRAKQKIRRFYGVTEKQFRKTFSLASRKEGMTSFQLLVLLELRLDNVIYRVGMAPSRSAARQFVTHGHVKVNGRKVNIASCTLKPNDVIELKSSDRSVTAAEKSIEITESINKIPEWVTFDKDAKKAQVIRLPEEGELHVPANEQLVVEFYSK